MNANVLLHDQYYLKNKSVFPIDVCTGISPRGILQDTGEFNVPYILHVFMHAVQLSECILVTSHLMKEIVS